MCKKIVLIAFVSLLSCSLYAKAKGFFNFEYAYDDRDFNMYSMHAQLKVGPKFEYFSLIDFYNEPETPRNADVATFYGEQTVYWQIAQGAVPVDLVSQWAMVHVRFVENGNRDDHWRFGARLRVSQIRGLERFFKAINMYYQLNLYPVAFDHRRGRNYKMEHIYMIDLFPKLLGNRLSLTGFIDHEFFAGNEKYIVMGHQLNLRLFDQFAIFAEHLTNEYEKRKKFQTGLQSGIKYMVFF